MVSSREQYGDMSVPAFQFSHTTSPHHELYKSNAIIFTAHEYSKTRPAIFFFFFFFKFLPCNRRNPVAWYLKILLLTYIFLQVLVSNANVVALKVIS